MRPRPFPSDHRHGIRLPPVDEEAADVGDVLDVVVLGREDRVGTDYVADPDGPLGRSWIIRSWFTSSAAMRCPFPQTSAGSSSAFASCQSVIAVRSPTALSELPSSLSTVSWTEW